MSLAPTELTEAELELQRDLRAFPDERLPEGSYPLSLGMPGHSDPQFSRDLGARGWLGMAISEKYGGGGGTAVERLIVVEELAARGATTGSLTGRAGRASSATARRSRSGSTCRRSAGASCRSGSG